MKFLEDGLKIFQERVDALGKKFHLSGVYTGSLGKLKSECLVCNYEWESLPSNLIKNGCPSCNKKVKGTFESFEAKVLRQNRGITIVPGEYKNRNSKFTFICNVCDHNWITSAGSILYQESGCPCCALGTWLTMDVIQERLDTKNRNITVSGEYVAYKEKISCTCNVCNLNWYTKVPALLCSGSGCPSCAKTGFDPDKPGYLYYLRVSENNENYWKIGITNLSVKARFKAYDRAKISVLYCHLFENGADAQRAEKNILEMFKDFKAKGLKILQTGNTELFTQDVLQMNHLNWGPI